ncbi:protein lin-54 homolog isoform X1 [Drosophila serrata]|uniref:protein lin-54 homolog isoform X1 n=2 Tax=Drosophila serrata TaxID=7274 RepID=UPI000A1D13BE|nr:protein lin-54 homolog isoform X1 [Drosophila serrata]
MSIYRLDYTADSLDDNTPLPELSFEDFLEPAEDKSPQHMDIDALDSEDEDVSGHDMASDSLHTPQFKKSTIHILENKRLTTSGMAPVLKTHAIKVVTSGTGLGSLGGTNASTTPVKPQITDVKILNKLKPLTGSSSSSITSNVKIVTAGTTGGVTKTLNNLTQIKTPDGRILYVQKSTPGTQTAAKVSTVAAPTTSGIRRLVAPSNIQKAVVSKSVTITGPGLVKAAVPVKAGATGSVPITIKGITPLVTGGGGGGSGGKTASTISPTSNAAAAPQAAKVHVVRTADGKIIKINQTTSSVLLNAKPPVAGSSAATPVAISPTKSNVVLGKPVSQVVLKTGAPAATSVKQANTTTGTVSNATSTGTPGKMLVQSGGKQILVSNKNIIKLSPKPGATSAVTNTAGGQGGALSTSGIHAVQVPGKGGVQYVRVLTNSKSTAGTAAAGTNVTTTSAAGSTSTATASVPVPRAMPGQKITVVRSQAGVFTSTSPSTSASTSASTTQKANHAVSSNSNKIIMRSMGSIVPLPSVQTLVSKRALGASTNATKSASGPSSSSGVSSQQESPRKHRLTDLNIQLKHLTASSGDASDSSDAGPEAKKPRFVITMQQGSQQQRLATGSNTSPIAAKKIYNFMKTTGTNGVKYMICNSGIPQASTSSMRRGYTGYVDSKSRRPLSIASQQARFRQMTPQQQAKHLQLQAQAKQRIRQQQLQSAGQAKGNTLPTLPTQPPQVTKAAAAGKPLFDILKPPSTGSGSVAAAEALAGMTSRRKHCNCSKSQCLKLYCDCFANGEFCQDCTCKDCFNNLDYEVERERAIRSCLDRNPSAFKPKITAPNSGDMRLHNKGCNCKRSGCLKNYCECYEAKIPCTSICKCVGCRNMEDRPDVDMDSLDGLLGVKGTRRVPDASDKHALKNRSKMYLTDDVIEATIMCMISRIVMHEKQGMPLEDTEREVMEELGESLNQIIMVAQEKNDTSAQLDESTAAS